MPRGGREQLTAPEIRIELLEILSEDPDTPMSEEAIKTRIRQRTGKVLGFLDWHEACDAELTEGRIERSSRTFLRLKLD